MRTKTRGYSDKSYVTLEQKQCIVCGCTYDSGALLLDMKLRDTFDHYTVTGNGLCPEHDKLFKDGFLALVECDEKKSTIHGSTIKPENAYRTGKITHIKRTVARKIFNVEIPDKLPMMFCNEETTALLESMRPKGEDENGKH